MAKKGVCAIIDGHALAYRAFYALPPLSSPDGTPTGAIHGFLLKLLKIRREVTRTIVVVFDGPGPTFRDEMSKEYKATRAEMPDELRAQLGILLPLIPKLGFPTIVEKGVEADDVIASLALHAAKQYAVEIFSGDKDLASLVNDDITLVAPGRQMDLEKRLDRAGVIEKYKVPPEKIPDLLSLMGDSSDNIPGVPGIGQVTAAKLIAEHGSVDGILAALDSLAPGARKKFEAGRESLELSRKLVGLRGDLDLPFEKLLGGEFPPTPEGLDTIRALGMKNIHAEFCSAGAVDVGSGAGAAPGESAPAATSGLAIPKTLILDETNLPDYLAKLRAAEIAVFDTETTGLNPRQDRLLGISFAAHNAPPAYLTMEKIGNARAALEKYFADPIARKCAHNAKFDAEILRAAGFSREGLNFDTMIASSLAGPLRRSHGLDALAMELFNHKMIPFESLGDLATVPLDQLAEYSGEDAWVTLLLHDEFAKALDNQGLRKLYDEIEHPLIFVLADMEHEGIAIDKAHFARLAVDFRAGVDELHKKAIEAAGEEFNPASPAQLGKILYEKLGLPTGKKTKSGYSTDVSALETLVDLHPLPGIILEYRELAKLLGTYIEALPKIADPTSGRIHTSYSQIRTATGRLASTDPNLQNIPIRTDRGKEIRRGFVSAQGKVLVTADYSQVEFRIIAHLANEKELLDAFRKGYDLHAATASKIWGVPIDEVDGELRRRAKAVNFGILYGQSAFGLARTLGVSNAEAKSIIEGYNATFHGIRTWIEGVLEEARGTGVVKTSFGRVRPVPEISSSRRNIREAVERIAVNTPIQGTAADIIKIAMIRIARRMAQIPGSAILLQVHDELVAEVPAERAKEAKEIMTKEMLGIEPFAPSLAVSTGCGKNWLEASH